MIKNLISVSLIIPKGTKFVNSSELMEKKDDDMI